MLKLVWWIHGQLSAYSDEINVNKQSIMILFTTVIKARNRFINSLFIYLL